MKAASIFHRALTKIDLASPRCWRMIKAFTRLVLLEKDLDTKTKLTLMTKVEEMAALLEDRAAAPQLRAMRKCGLSWKPTRVGRAHTEPSVSPSSTGAATYEGSRNRRVQARFTATGSPQPVRRLVRNNMQHRE